MAWHRLLGIVGFLGLLAVGVVEVRENRNRPQTTPQEVFYRMGGGFDKNDEACELAGGMVARAPARDDGYVETGYLTISYRGQECIQYSLHVQESPTYRRTVPSLCCFDALDFTPRPR